MRYRFTIDYASSQGMWAKGEEVELDDETAAWLLRDVAGCIEPVEESSERAKDAPQHDRQMKRAPRTRNRSA